MDNESVTKYRWRLSRYGWKGEKALSGIVLVSTPDTPKPLPPALGQLAMLAALAVWVLAFDLWLARHFGASLTEPWQLIGLPTGAALMAWLSQWLLTKGEREAIPAGFKGMLRRGLLRWPMVAALYVSALVAGLSYSSLTLVSSKEMVGTEVCLAPLGSKATKTCASVAAAGQPINLPVWIALAGTQMVVEADGFLPELVGIAPYLGSSLVADKDLTRLPTIVFRPSVAGLRALRGEGRFRLSLKRADDSTHPLGEEAKGPTTFRVGPARPVPTANWLLWELELSAQQHTGNVRAETLIAWRGMQAIQGLPHHIGPGARLYAEVVTRVGKPVESAEVLVGREAFIDVPLVAVR